MPTHSITNPSFQIFFYLSPWLSSWFLLHASHTQGPNFDGGSSDEEEEQEIDGDDDGVDTNDGYETDSDVENVDGKNSY